MPPVAPAPAAAPAGTPAQTVPPPGPTDFVGGLVTGLFPNLSLAQQGTAEVPALIVSGLATAVGGALKYFGHAIAGFLTSTADHLIAFSQGNVVPLLVAAVVCAVLFG